MFRVVRKLETWSDHDHEHADRDVRQQLESPPPRSQKNVTLRHTRSRRTSFEFVELKFFDHVGTARACSALGTVVSGEAVSCKGLEVNVSPHFEASLII